MVTAIHQSGLSFVDHKGPARQVDIELGEPTGDLATLEPSASPVYVTRPLTPPLEEIVPLLTEVWESRLLTNRGPMNLRLEQALREHLDVRHPTLVANGTLGLLTALFALELPPGSEVITTPFSFAATSHAILTAGLVPVFVDIDRSTYNLDPAQIEAALTERTGAIVPVHCFGRACDTEAIDRIAAQHDLPVVYDAAHAFGVRHRGKSLAEFGQMSVLSFHATKVFNTLEGGCVVAAHQELKEKLERLTNYGFSSEAEIPCLGLNAKLNEVSCAVGLAGLPWVEAAMERRANIAATYRSRLASIETIRVPPIPPDQTQNHAYFPIEVTDAHPKSRDEVMQQLLAENIYARRYFYPVLPDLASVKRGMKPLSDGAIPHARDVASRIICLPIYPELDPIHIHRIADLLQP